MSFPVPLPLTFMPLPLAIMIPFMVIQSGVMAQQFVMNFQYGKRKISAMSNEEFNKLTPEKMQADFSNMIKGMIPTFEQSLKEMRPFQRMIFVEMVAAFKEAVDLGLDIAKAGLGIPPSGDVPIVDPHKFLSPAQILEHKKHGHLGGLSEDEPVVAPPKVVTGKYSAIQLRLFQQVKSSDARITSFIHTIKNLKAAIIKFPRAADSLKRTIAHHELSMKAEVVKLTTLMEVVLGNSYYVTHTKTM